MPDLEKVMWSLARCSCGVPDACSDCCYDNWPPRICVQHLTNDALTLLKAQEPRVMTLAEALAADYVYLEIKLHASLPCDCCILAIDPDGGILPLKKGFAGYLDGEEYGETWRCWTARPTEEQRRKTSWPK